MSGFLSTMSGFLSSMSAKNMSMRDSLPTMSDSTKNGAIQLQWMALTIQLFGLNSFFKALQLL